MYVQLHKLSSKSDTHTQSKAPISLSPRLTQLPSLSTLLSEEGNRSSSSVCALSESHAWSGIRPKRERERERRERDGERGMDDDYDHRYTATKSYVIK